METRRVKGSGYIKWQGEETFGEIIEYHIKPLEGLCKIASSLANYALSQTERSPANIFRNGKGIVKKTLEQVELLLAEAQIRIDQIEAVLLEIEKDFKQGNEIHNRNNFPHYFVDLTWIGSSTFDAFSWLGLVPLKSLFDIAYSLLFEITTETEGSLERDINYLTHLIIYMANRVRTLDIAVFDLMDECSFVLVQREMEFSGSRISYCSLGSNASNSRYRRPQLLPTALRSARLVSCVEPHSRFLVARNLLLLSPQGKTVLPFYT